MNIGSIKNENFSFMSVKSVELNTENYFHIR